MKRTIPTSAGGTGVLMTLISFLAQTRPATAERYLVVGDPGNPAAPANAGGAAGSGSVPNNFRIGTWEVTNGEWVAFLNTVATGRVEHADPHGLYDSRMTSDPRGGITRHQEGTAITGYDVKTNDMEEWFPLPLFSGSGGPRIVHYTPPLLGNWDSMFFRAMEYNGISNTP